MGGLVAVQWVLRPSVKINALILSSPFLGLRLPRFLIQFNNLMNQFFPKFNYQNPVYPPHLSHNPEEIKAYKQDPLIQRRMSVRLLHESMLAMERLAAIPSFQFSFPLYVLTAGMEKVVDGDRTRAFFDKVQAPAKEMKVFEGFYHEIFNELDQQKAFQALKECFHSPLTGKAV